MDRAVQMAGWLRWFCRLVGPAGGDPIRTLAGNHRQRSLQGEVQDGFRGQLDLLSLGGCLYSATQSAASRRANCSSLATARDSANDSPNAGAGSDLRGGILATRRSLARVLVGLNAVVLAYAAKAVELQREQRLSRELASALHGDNMAFDVEAGGNDHFSIHGQR